MSRDIVTIAINGVGFAQFAADNITFDVETSTVTLTCTVPDTQSNPVTIDPRTESLLGVAFTNRSSGEQTTLTRLSSPSSAAGGVGEPPRVHRCLLNESGGVAGESK